MQRPDLAPGRPLDAIRLEIYRHQFGALAEEMGAALRRAAHSPNIKERRDYSCAVLDGRGRPVALGDHMPVHLGALPMSVAAALAEAGPLAPGDVVVLNDPFHGGTHLPDLTLVMGVWAGRGAAGVGEAAGKGIRRVAGGGDSAPLAYLAARAHHADVGGMAPGSMPLAREVFQEGLRIPPVRLITRGRRNEDAWRLILANVRTPVEREGDLEAQLAALAAGERRLRELAAARGKAEVALAMETLLGYADRMVRAGLSRLPAGRYEAADVMEDDGLGGGPFPIRVALTLGGGELHVDFTGTAPQAAGGINAVEAMTVSAVRYVVRCLVEAVLGEPLPAGGGEMAPVRVTLPRGSLVAALPPASVAAGNVETSQRITDVLLLALAPAAPGLVPAQSQGTMNNVTIGGIDPRGGSPYTYYETVAGGMGAGPAGDGLSGVHVHMTNSWNTPVEAIEHAYPFRIRRYELRRGTGGAGRYRGGDGVRRDLELLGEADVSLLSERRRLAPSGLAGGRPGAVGENVLLRDGQPSALPAKVSFRAAAGDVLSIRTPGGGGWGA